MNEAIRSLAPRPVSDLVGFVQPGSAQMLEQAGGAD